MAAKIRFLLIHPKRNGPETLKNFVPKYHINERKFKTTIKIDTTRLVIEGDEVTWRIEGVPNHPHRTTSQLTLGLHNNGTYRALYRSVLEGRD